MEPPLEQAGTGTMNIQFGFKVIHTSKHYYLIARKDNTASTKCICKETYGAKFEISTALLFLLYIRKVLCNRFFQQLSDTGGNISLFPILVWGCASAYHIYINGRVKSLSCLYSMIPTQIFENLHSYSLPGFVLCIIMHMYCIKCTNHL